MDKQTLDKQILHKCIQQNITIYTINMEYITILQHHNKDNITTANVAHMWHKRSPFVAHSSPKVAHSSPKIAQ